MGKPLPPAANPSTGVPISGDRANAVVSGTFTGVGQTSLPFCFYGAFNISIWASVSTTLTTLAASATAYIGTVTGIAVGENINSVAVPPGTTVGGPTGTLTSTITLGGLTTAQISGITAVSVSPAIIVGNGATVDATVILERSFDGGSTWLTVSADKIGTPMVFVLGIGHLTYPVSIILNDPEVDVAYRLNCSVYTSGTINYRISETGSAATTWAPGAGT